MKLLLLIIINIKKFKIQKNLKIMKIYNYKIEKAKVLIKKKITKNNN